MSSKRIERREWSMEGRLLLLFTAGATALLIAVSVTLYWAILNYMGGRANAFLADKSAEAQEDMNEPGGIQAEAMNLAAPLAGEPAYWLRILDANGTITAETRDMARQVPKFEFPTPSETEVARRDYMDGKGRWMSLAAWNVKAQGANFTIQIAENRREDGDFLGELRWILGGLIAAGAAFSGGMALVATRRGLRPLGAMEQAVARVSAQRLNERLGEREWPRELAPLAAVFDEMMDRIEDSFTRLSQFSADLAHELRTPIANLRGEAEVALTRSRSAEEYRQVIESSMEEYERLTEMTAKLLFLARADADETEMTREDLDARALIDTLREFYEPIAEERGVTLKSEGLGLVKADGALLRRAVANLIENALRFTPPGGEVTVEVESRGVVRVKDNGCGIAPEHLPRIFDRFYQVDPARREGGTGLGLALVKSIMKLHGGRVTITSEPGKGTEATLRFPG